MRFNYLPDESLPLTAAQREIWLAEQRLGGPSSVYRVGEYVKIDGPVDQELLELAIRQVLSDVDTIHSRIFEDSGKLRQVVDSSPAWSIPVVDLRNEFEPMRVAIEWMQRDIDQPMDVLSGPLFRYAFLQIRTDCLIWYHSYHHIAMDAIGAQLVARRVASVYNSRAEAGPEDQRRFGSLKQLVDDDLQYRESDRYLEDRAFWIQKFSDFPQPTRLLPPRRSAPTSFVRRTSWVSPESLDRMRSVARRARVPASQIAIAVCAVYVHRMTGESDVVLGLPLGARTSVVSRVTPATASNVLPLRISVRPSMSTGDLLLHVSGQVADAAAHQRYRGEDLQRELGPSVNYTADYAPVINVMSLDYDLRFGAHRASVHNLSSGLVGDMAIAVWNRNDGRGLQVDFNAHSDLCTEKELAAHQDRFGRLFDAYSSKPPSEHVGRLGLIPAFRQDNLPRLASLQIPSGPYVANTSNLADAFESVAAATPNRPALTFGSLNFTYFEVDAQANRLAQRLISFGVGPEDLVGLVASRTPEAIVAMLAILKAGAAYLPLDPMYPPSRLRFMIDDARPLLIVGDQAGIDAMPVTANMALLAVGEIDKISNWPLSNPTDDDRVTSLNRHHSAYVIYTSGSTGRPKGVTVTHHNVLRLFDATKAQFDLNGNDVWTLFHSLSFDFSVWEVWGALLHGGRLVIVPYDVSRSPTAFLRLLASQKTTVLSQTPSAFYPLSEAAQAESVELSLRLVVFGGEALQPDGVRPWLVDMRTAATLVNMYGITETTVHATQRLITDADTVPPTASVIGTGLDHLHVEILDPGLQSVWEGGTGELYVGGDGVARGYLGQPALTASRFVASPTGAPGSRMYRTGDLARTSHGVLQYKGRSDNQIKLRGFRIELGEIESVISRQPGVAHAAVLACADTEDNAVLVAYVVPAHGETIGVDALRSALRADLPYYMVPSTFVEIARLPLTQNGKLDRAALPAPEESGSEERPRTEAEASLCELFSELLGRKRVGPDDSFFDLGGHSLSATRLSARLRSDFDLEMGIREIFEAPTAASIAKKLGFDSPARLALTRVDRPNPMPLSFAQRRLWFLYHLDGEVQGSSYNIPIILRLAGVLDRDALRAALEDLVARHEPLRTTFPDTDGQPRQEIHEPSFVAFDTTEASEESMPALLAAAAQHRYELPTEMPFRAELFAVAPEEHVLLILVHHIAADGWSITPLGRDLAIAYKARKHGLVPVLPDLDVQYADYCLWQRERLGDPSDPSSYFAMEIEYWKSVLAGLPDCVSIPTDRARPAIASHRGGYFLAKLPGDLHSNMVALARDHDASLFMVFVAGLASLLTRLGAGTDIPIGGPVAGRGDQMLDDVIGLFVNTIVLRVDTSGDPTFSELLIRVRDMALSAYSHQEVPFDSLVDVLKPTRSLAHHPLFQVNLTLRNSEEAPFSLEGLDVSSELGYTNTAKFDLFVELTEQHDDEGGPNGVLGTLEFATDLFDLVSIRTLWDRWMRLLSKATAVPEMPVSAIEICDPAERLRITENSTGRVTAPVVRSLSALVQDRLAEEKRVVLVSGSSELTGRELNSRANGLAHALIAEGVGRGTMVALLVDRSVDAVVAILAVLKAGGTYVPLDRRYPPSRISVILADTCADLVLMQRGQSSDGFGSIRRLFLDDPQFRIQVADRPTTEPYCVRSSNDIAYVMYTSGSTGRPKGIAVTDENVAALALDPSWELGQSERVLLHSSLAFDASTFELWVPLLRAGTIVIAPIGEFDVAGLSEFITATEVTMLWLTAAVFDVVAENHPTCFRNVSCVLAGGEALSPHAVRKVLEACPSIVVVNGYGPTETTTFSTSHRMSAPWSSAITVPIGRPLAGRRTYVLDARLQLVPTGVPGELYIAGTGLSLGYIHQFGLTSSRFVADPFGSPGERMYRSGDLARWTAQGTLEFLGRADGQVKVRGFRIETAEIEACLIDHPQVDRVAVRLMGSRLTAYMVGTAVISDLQAMLKRRLPAYMVPTAVVRLQEFPLTANGKLDVAALPIPPLDLAPYREAVSSREVELCDIFSEVLNLEKVGPDDDFFALGGDSISSIRLVSYIRQMGLLASVADVFENRTAAALAQNLAEITPQSMVAVSDETGNDEIELTPIMCWLLERGSSIDQFYQSMLLQSPPQISREGITSALRVLIDHHDMLRAHVIKGQDATWRLDVDPCRSVDPELFLRVVDISGLDELNRKLAFRAEARSAVNRLSTDLGIMAQVVWFDCGPDHPGRVLLVVHHLVMDGVSWHILVPDFIAALSDTRLPPVGTSFAAWSRYLHGLAHAPSTQSELPMWIALLEDPDPLLTARRLDRSRDLVRTARTFTAVLPADITEPLLARVPSAFHAGTQDVLLTALALALGRWRSSQFDCQIDSVLIDLEGHGRDGDADLSRTLGWFTIMHPVRLDPGSHRWEEVCAGGPILGTAIKRVKEQLRAVPGKGRGFGLLRYLNQETSATLAALPAPQVGFNYIGRFAGKGTSVVPGRHDWQIANELDMVGGLDGAMPLAHGLEVDSSVRDHHDGPRLTATWSWASELWNESEVKSIADFWFAALRGFVSHSGRPDSGGHSPSDFPLVEFGQQDIERLEAMWGAQE